MLGKLLECWLRVRKKLGQAGMCPSNLSLEVSATDIVEVPVLENLLNPGLTKNEKYSKGSRDGSLRRMKNI
jgi:hypothetical protein